jgi:hypothetical protein
MKETSRVRFAGIGLLLLFGVLAGWAFWKPANSSKWTLTKESEAVVPDAELRKQIFKALDAAEKVHTDPPISHFQVRVATVVKVNGKEEKVLGGNSEYGRPQGLHGETSLLTT